MLVLVVWKDMLLLLMPWCIVHTCTHLISGITNGEYPLLFSSPEMLKSTRWFDILAEENFEPKLLSVCFDEAHTLIDWDTFRPCFSFLPEIITNLCPDAAYHMVTATCNDELKQIILTSAGLQDNDFICVTALPNRYRAFYVKCTSCSMRTFRGTYMHSTTMVCCITNTLPFNTWISQLCITKWAI